MASICVIATQKITWLIALVCHSFSYTTLSGLWECIICYLGNTQECIYYHISCMFWSDLLNFMFKLIYQDLCCKSTQLDKDIGDNYENQSMKFMKHFSSVKYVLM